MKRLLCLLVCLLICEGAFSSCGLIVINKPQSESESESLAESVASDSTGSEETAVRRRADLRAKEYMETIGNEEWGGAVIKITSTSPALTDTDDSPQIISYAVEERNRAVEEKLGVVITTDGADEGTLFAELSASVRSGMYYSNLIVLPQDSVMSFAASGLLFNLRSLPEFDLDEPYFNASSVEAASAGYDCYAVAGEMTYSPYEFMGMFFASDRLSELGLESPYPLVDRGEWTLDRFFEYCAAADGYAPIVTGKHGEESADAFYVASGRSFMSSGVRKYPTVAMYAKTIDDDIAPIKSVFAQSGALTGDAGGVGAFTKSGLFMADRISAAYTLSTSEVRWGLLPLPKASAEQESYVTPASGDSLMMAVPSGLYADVQSAKVLRAIAAASAGRIPLAFVEHTQYNLLQNNESALMLDVILENVKYDFAYSAGALYPNTAPATYGALRSAVFGGESAGAAISYYAPMCEGELAAAFHMD